MFKMNSLENETRLLIEADLAPLQGSRFQPTGFPNQGAAVYDGPDGSRTLLVESAQSMANRLELVCWDAVADNWQKPLVGLPFVKVIDKDSNPLTNSILEAHRLNSEYIARSEDFKIIAADLAFRKDRAFDIRKQLIPFLLKYDINSLIHGVFLEEIAGVIRLPRTLSSFIEAENVNIVQSGGVKFNRIEPSLKEGIGNVPYPREEYTSSKITAYFNIDLSQLRAFGLGEQIETLLLLIMFYKIHRFINEGLRLRTACDLDLVDFRVTRPKGFSLPELHLVAKELPKIINSVSSENHFSNPHVTIIKWRK